SFILSKSYGWNTTRLASKNTAMNAPQNCRNRFSTKKNAAVKTNRWGLRFFSQKTASESFCFIHPSCHRTKDVVAFGANQIACGSAINTRGRAKFAQPSTKSFQAFGFSHKSIKKRKAAARVKATKV